MAIKPRVTLVDEFDYISFHDDCWDKEAEGFDDAWERYLDGAEMPPMKEGAKPTVFKLRPIASNRMMSHLRGVQAEQGTEAFAVATAAVCVTGWENFTGADGKQIKCKREHQDGYLMLTEQCLNLLDYALILDLAGRVFTHQNPSPD